MQTSTHRPGGASHSTHRPEKSTAQSILNGGERIREDVRERVSCGAALFFFSQGAEAAERAVFTKLAYAAFAGALLANYHLAKMMLGRESRRGGCEADELRQKAPWMCNMPWYVVALAVCRVVAGRLSGRGRGTESLPGAWGRLAAGGGFLPDLASI